MAIQGRQHVMNNYNFETHKKRWVEIMDDLIERHGSWDNRKLYERWQMMEVA